MTCSIRRALGVAVVAAAGGVVPLTAQQTAPPPPQVTVGGVVYGQYLYQLKDSLGAGDQNQLDRKSTRLNSSHSQISYAVFCLKKKNVHMQGIMKIAAIDRQPS